MSSVCLLPLHQGSYHDVMFLVHILQDKESAASYFADGPRSFRGAVKFLVQCQQGQHPTIQNWYCISVTNSASNTAKVVGMVGFGLQDTIIHIDMLLYKKYWKRGIAHLAGLQLLQIALQCELVTDSFVVCATTTPGNEHVHRMLEKLQFNRTPAQFPKYCDATIVHTIKIGTLKPLLVAKARKYGSDHFFEQ